jgi:dienelactone hydrolase
VNDGTPRHVAWLADAQRPLDRPRPALGPLLVDKDGSPITTLKRWQARREELRSRWLTLLRPFARVPVAPPLQVVGEESLGEVRRRRVRYATEPGLTTDAYLLMPAAQTAPAPGVVVFHSTVDESIDEPAGVVGPPVKAFGLEFARRGFVALCPRNFLWRRDGAFAPRRQTFRLRLRHPRCTGMAKMLLDGMAAVDVLAGLPEVDASRLAVVGHSLGAKQALYLAAFDERVRAAAAHEGGIGLRLSNWDAPWYLGRQVRRRAFDREHHELLALVAPRAFLVLGGNGFDGPQSWPLIEAALPAYQLYGRPARIGLYDHGQGHKVVPEAAERIYQWCEAYC